jgi:hypothetical protein
MNSRLQKSPFFLSEADMATAYVRGVQENGVAAAVEHFPGDVSDTVAIIVPP